LNLLDRSYRLRKKKGFQIDATRINGKGGKAKTPPPPPQPPEIKALRQLTNEEFVKGFNDLLHRGHAELFQIYSDPEMPILRSYLARCLLIGKMRGDFWTLNLMLDRIIGKVKEPADPDKEDALKELLTAMISAAKVAAK